MEADEALAAFAQELVRGVISLSAVPTQLPDHGGHVADPVPHARTGAGSVHPHLGGHLVTPLAGDTISGHAHKHVPRPYQVQGPDAKDLKLAGQKLQLEQQANALQQASDYRQASRELDKHAAELESRGIALPGTWKPWTPDEHASHARFAEDSINRALEGGKATTATETHGGTGQVWSASRAAQHRDIIHKILDGAQGVPSGGKSVLVAGIPSAQRDRVAKLAAPEKDYVHASAARITGEMARRGMIPEVKGLSPMEASPLVHDEAAHVTALLAREAARRGKNVALHTAMSDPEAARAHAEGRHVIFAHVSPARAAESAASHHKSGHESWRRQESAGARYLPPALVRSADAGNGQTVNSRAFEALKPHLQSWEHWDTDGEPKKTGSHGSHGHRIPAPEELVRLTADSAVRLSAILDWLEKGRITLPDAAARLRRLGLHKGTSRSAAQVLGASANGDVPHHDGTSFAEVEAAYIAGKVTRAQYEYLAEAVMPSAVSPP